MASIVNKRQQARNEKALQDLIRSVPGNDRCADCMARNPGWASWSLGIFLCMRCAALHRKLGTHISKVKSLSMDSWSNEQVDKMKNVGNTVSNKVFNPRNVKPVIPIDSDEVDIALEKFIRDKYQRRTLIVESPRDLARTRSLSSASTDDQPPPLPPKTAPRFGASLRSSSAVLLGSKRGITREKDRYDGATQEEKLSRLKDMGFKDEKRNVTVLKGHGGDLQKTVETLVRLSEDDKVTVPVQIAQHTNSFPSPEPLQPPQPAQSIQQAQLGRQQQQFSGNFGASGGNRSVSATNSYNPFDVPTQTQPHPSNQQQQQQQQTLEQGFQAMQIAPQVQQLQPLFPHNTGTWQQQSNNNPFMKTFTPPISPSPNQNAPQQYYQNIQTVTALSQPNQFQQQQQLQPVQPDAQASMQRNPFLRAAKSQEFRSGNPFNASPVSLVPPQFTQYSQLQQQQQPPIPSIPSWAQTGNSNDFSQNSFRQQPQVQSPSNLTTTPQGHSYFQISPIQESPQSVGLQQQQQQQQPQYPFPNQNAQPQLSQQLQIPNQYQYQYQYQQQQSPTSTTFTPLPSTFDKNSILALYSQPQVQTTTTRLPISVPENEVSRDLFNSQQEQQYQQQQPQQRSNTVPPLGNVDGYNPFATTTQVRNTGAGYMTSNHASGMRPQVQASQHVRDESLAFGGSMMMMNGRHSPDAFANLSARYS